MSPATTTPAPIQCSTGPFWAMELERALDLIAEAGFVEIELMVTRDPKTHDAEVPRELAQDRGLKVVTLHGPFLVITKSVWGLDPVTKIRRGAEMCRDLGATSMIVHPPYLWERAYARWVTKDSEAFAHHHRVTVAVETMYPLWAAGRRLRAYRWLEPEALVKAAPAVAMDTSHLTVARLDVLDAYQTLAPRLTHIHLSNNAGDGRDGHLELEQGIVSMDRFLADVRRSNYAGAISLELSIGRYLERPKALVKMLRRNREYVEDRLSRVERAVKGMPRR